MSNDLSRSQSSLVELCHEHDRPMYSFFPCCPVTMDIMVISGIRKIKLNYIEQI